MNNLTEIHYCECNCGGITKPGSRFLPGHHMRLPEYRHKCNPENYITKICPYCGEEFQCYKSCPTKYCCQEHYGLDKRNKPISESQLAALREANCGREPWNKDLTKDDDPRIQARGCFKKGHPAWNSGLTKETDERVAKYSVPKSLEARKAIAIASSKRVMDGVLRTPKFYKHGWITLDRLGIKVYYRSSYELRALLLLDNYSGVIKVSSESIRIEYKKEDESIHYYIPDLLVTTIDGLTYIVEIKPKGFVGASENQIKFEAARKYAAKHNMIFLVWTEDILFNKNGVTTELARATSSATAANLFKVDDTV